jgi:hypothetical protein
MGMLRMILKWFIGTRDIEGRMHKRTDGWVDRWVVTVSKYPIKCANTSTV